MVVVVVVVKVIPSLLGGQEQEDEEPVKLNFLSSGGRLKPVLRSLVGCGIGKRYGIDVFGKNGGQFQNDLQKIVTIKLKA